MTTESTLSGADTGPVPTGPEPTGPEPTDPKPAQVSSPVPVPSPVVAGDSAEAEPQSVGTVVTPVPGGRQVTVRRARVAVTRIDPWSVMKLSFVLSLVLVLVLLVAAVILWSVLNSSGVFDQLNTTLSSVTGSDSLRLQQLISLDRVLSYGGLVGLIDVVLLTALSTLAAFLFNLATGLVGGIDVVLTETD